VPDIHNAAAKMLAEAGHTPLGIDRIRSFIGNGVPALISKIMHDIGEPAEDPARHALLEKSFTHHYVAAPAELGQVFDNVQNTLMSLSKDGFSLAVCTNKPEAIARQILKDLKIASYFRAVVGGDSLTVRKPDPAPLQAAMHMADATAAIYVGDSEVDSETAQAAGVPFLLFTKGYRKSPLSEIQNQGLFSDFAELPALIRTELSRTKTPCSDVAR
jgi:phosphoglycolate phosphatase